MLSEEYIHACFVEVYSYSYTTAHQHSHLRASICPSTSDDPLLATFLLLVPVSLTLIVAYVLYQCQQPRRVFCNAKHFGVMFVQLIAMISTLARFNNCT